MAELIDIDNNIPHKVSEVICIKCLHRWIAIRPAISKLKNLKCARCNEQGYIIETGEVFE